MRSELKPAATLARWRSPCNAVHLGFEVCLAGECDEFLIVVFLKLTTFISAVNFNIAAMLFKQFSDTQCCHPS